MSRTGTSEAETKTFFVRYRVGKRMRRLTIGDVDRVGLADARTKARSILVSVDTGWNARSDSSLRSGHFEKKELRRFWPAVWRRWLVAVAPALAAAAAFGAGHLWATRPYDAEIVTLRSRVELLDFAAQRIITMTPSERRQFETLMKGAAAAER